jgi:hypothetical protein
MGHVGLEPTTYGLKVRYSAIELMTLLCADYTISYRLVKSKTLSKGGGNRTLIYGFGDRYSTVELRQ